MNKIERKKLIDLYVYLDQVHDLKDSELYENAISKAKYEIYQLLNF